MAKLTYWVAQCITDAETYSLIAKTKKGLQAQLKEMDFPEAFGPIEKAFINYSDAFDLFDKSTSSAGGRYYAGYRG